MKINRRGLLGKLMVAAAGLFGVKVAKADQGSANLLLNAARYNDPKLDKLIVGGVRRARPTMLDVSLPEHQPALVRHDAIVVEQEDGTIQTKTLLFSSDGFFLGIR